MNTGTCSFVQEEEPDLELELQPPNGSVSVYKSVLQEGDVSTVVRREGGARWTSVLYIRAHLVAVQKELDNFIQSQQLDQLYITGPPGCGKTCFLYLWARRLSVLDNKRVLIIQFREKQPGFIWIRDSSGVLWRVNETIEPSDLQQKVKEIINKNSEESTCFDLCIHDGVLDKLTICSGMLSTLNTAVTNGTIGKVAHVTSLAFTLSTGGQLLNSPLSTIVEVSLDSWCEAEYTAAVSCEPFMKEMAKNATNPFPGDTEFLLSNDPDADDDDDDTNTNSHKTLSAQEVVQAKYFYAGGSARFMFQFHLGKLKEDLDSRMKRVDQGDWQSFTQKSVSSGTASAVNTLMQQFGRTCTPLSKYVLFCAYEKCKTALVKSVRAAAQQSSNPALAGWAFELEQIDLIRLSYESNSDNPVFVTNGMGFSLRPTSEAAFDETYLTSGDVIDGAVIWCQKWNQGCFDVAFYVENTLITVQFTLQKSHSLKPYYIRKLRDALEEKGLLLQNCVHVGMREKDWNDMTFIWETAGTGRQKNEEAAEFVVEVCRSPPMRNSNARAESVNCAIPETMELLSTEKMWKLSDKKRRIGEP